MLQQLIEIANSAGEVLLNMQTQVRSDIRHNDGIIAKGRGDFATNADLEAEKIIKAKLNQLYPDIPIVAEESNLLSVLPNTYITVDPLDGTIIYSRGASEWGTSICLIENGSPKCGVVRFPRLGITLTTRQGQGSFINDDKVKLQSEMDESKFILAMDIFYKTDSKEILDFLLPLIKSERVLISRSQGCAVGSTLSLLKGEVDAYYCGRAKVWDIATCHLAVQEAGGSVGATLEETFDWSNLQKGQVFASDSKLASELARLARSALKNAVTTCKT